MRTSAITVVGVIIGCISLLSGCFPQPSARELYNRTHFNYSVVQVPEEPEASGGAEGENNGRAEADANRSARVEKAFAVDPQTIDAVFEANADIIRYCVKGLESR